MHQFAFALNVHDEDEGLNDPGIEAFRHAPLESLARECGQNSLDARVKLPLHLKFLLREVPTSEVPGSKSLLEAIRQGLKKYSVDDAKSKEQEYFSNCVQILERPTIHVLEISDHNTTGLKGPCVPGTPFHALVKAVGVSQKSQSDSAGSFGIGKFAAFAASPVRTVFYSSRYVDDSNNNCFLAQGKTVQVSHQGVDGKDYLRIGYWGNPGAKAVSSTELVPHWMARADIGTSVFIVGFAAEKDWKQRVAAMVLSQFFAAIEREELEVTILDNGSELHISRSSIAELFEATEIQQVADSTCGTEEFELAKGLLGAIRKSAPCVMISVEHVGNFRVQIDLHESFPKRVLLVRNGMRIADNLSRFGEKFARFPSYRGFIALVEPEDPGTSSVLKELESPQHNELSAQRIVNPARAHKLDKAMRLLAKRVRDCIRQLALPTPEKQIELDELAEFFASDVQSGKKKEQGGELSVEKLIVEPISAVEQKKLSKSSVGPGDKGGSKDSRRRGKGKGNQGKGTGTGKGTGGSGNSGAGGANVENVRYILGTSGLRKLSFVSALAGKCRIRLAAPGMGSPTPIPVASSNMGIVENGDILVDLEVGTKQTIQFQTMLPYAGPIVANFIPEKLT